MEKNKSELREQILAKASEDPADKDAIEQLFKNAVVEDIAERLRNSSYRNVRLVWFFVSGLTEKK